MHLYNDFETHSQRGTHSATYVTSGYDDMQESKSGLAVYREHFIIPTAILKILCSFYIFIAYVKKIYLVDYSLDILLTTDFHSKP